LWVIFGKDKHARQDAQGPEDIEDEANKEEENDEATKKDAPESLSMQEPSKRVETSSVKLENLGKQTRISKNLVKGLLKVASILGGEIRAASSEISRAVGFDIEFMRNAPKLNQELTILGLTTMERHRAIRKITSKLENIDIFFSIPDAKKKSGCKLYFGRYLYFGSFIIVV